MTHPRAATLVIHPRAAFGVTPSRGQREWPGEAGSTAFPV